MAVQFLIGRAGTGKSTRCAREMRAEGMRDPLGGALFWITPEQGTFTAERMLLAGEGGGRSEGGGGAGTFRAQVLSFRRLASLIGREVGFLEGERIKPMEEVVRVVLLEEVVRAQKEKLRIFAGVAERPGFVQKLDATLRELRQHGHTGESLREIAGRKDVEAVTGRKLHDLAVLLDAWGAVIDARDAWDFEKIMHHAALRMGESALITGGAGEGGERARVWVDGFSAMSALELRMVVALAEHSGGVTITLLADPDAGPIRDIRCWPKQMGVFARTERLYCRLMDLFRKHRVAVGRTEALRTSYRFHGEALVRVERDLFERPELNTKDTKSTKDHKGGRGKAGEGTATNLQGDLFSSKTRGVEIWECSDPETEVRVAAQTIRQMVIGAAEEERLRYREIGVIVPDLEGYQDAIRRIFGEHEIPHFIDQRRGIAHHPVVELLRSAVAIATSRWDRDEVLLYLKTGLTGIGAADVAVVENYIIEHGISHVPWSVAWKWFAPNQKEEEEGEVVMAEHERELLVRVNGIRQRVWESLRAWMDICNACDTGDARTCIDGLRELLKQLRVDEQITEWVAAARKIEGGDAELAQVHEQVWRQVQEMLGVLATAMEAGSRVFTLEDFSRILGTALETLTLGLIPPTVDQVLISSVTRSRVPGLRAVMILGAIEGQFPKVVEEDPILSDGQREFFNGQTADPIGPGSDGQLLEMQFFDYSALTRASERLIVSYPLADRRGRAVGRSRYVMRLRELLEECGLVERKFDAASRTSLERIGTVDDLLAGIAAWARASIRQGGDGGNERMRELYDWLVHTSASGIAAALERVWKGVRERPAPGLKEELAARFYPPTRDLRMSVSQLEKFAACPLQYFMHYTLGLRPRAALEMDVLNLGLLYHRILERVYLHILDGELPWPECDPQTLRRTLDQEVQAATEELHAELAEQTPAYEKMRARTRRVLGIVLEGQRRRACAGEMRPVGVEVGFGAMAEGVVRRGKEGQVVSLPVLRIPTPVGRGVELMGKIDRVDASEGGRVAVIDYKSSSSRELKLDWVYWGLQLQLPVYAIVMEELGRLGGKGTEAIAAMYVPLGVKREKVDRAAEADDAGSDAFYQKYTPRGLVDADGAHLLDDAVAPHEDEGEKSKWYRIGFNKKPPLVPKTGDMVEHDDFRTVLEFVRWKIGRMVDDLTQGKIAPAPYRSQKESPCDNCDFFSLCPFDKVSGTYREVPKMGRVDAIDRMRADMQGAP
ncbi:MAG TPA: PD-(D/E)XK nuclease family protein [Phycisphaerae bacterium]|nr:PD-(D/E)XK nuclease family protein [Phycisphaerae bacterium]